jgi:hypothetical protein
MTRAARSSFHMRSRSAEPAARNGAHTSHRSGISPAPVDTPKPEPTNTVSFELRFEVGRRALAQSDARVTPQGPEPHVIFHARKRGSKWVGTVELHDALTDTRHTLTDADEQVEWTEDTASRLWHVDSPSLRATLDLSSRKPRVLYASTPVFTRLGLRGGRYDA